MTDAFYRNAASAQSTYSLQRDPKMNTRQVSPATTEPLVYIILLNWNGWPDTLQCLESLGNLAYTNYRILVIDNGSTDDSVERLRNSDHGIRLMENGENLGFAKACNVGIREALREGAEYAWLLNNDTVVGPSALRALVGRAEQDRRVGGVGSVVYYLDKPEQVQAWGGGYVNFWLGHSRHFTSRVSEQKVGFITGASLLLSGRALSEIGLLDEQFFMYWEDADWAFRLKRAGWRLAVAEKSVVWHKESAAVGRSSPRLDTYFNTSAVRFFRKNAPLPMFSVWSGVGLRLLKRMIFRDWVRVRAVWRGVRIANG
ncbi:MAG TPA: glycosyltransferase family 2 protein [Terriglobia bacterium]|nr:glycosyltransferase family 2 protein [Terriglobia bacterium]